MLVLNSSKLHSHSECLSFGTVGIWTGSLLEGDELSWYCRMFSDTTFFYTRCQQHLSPNCQADISPGNAKCPWEAKFVPPTQSSPFLPTPLHLRNSALISSERKAPGNGVKFQITENSQLLTCKGLKSFLFQNWPIACGLELFYTLSLTLA